MPERMMEEYTTAVSGRRGRFMGGLTWMADVEIYQVTFDIHSALGRCISHLTNLMTIVTTLCCSDKAKEKRVSWISSSSVFISSNAWC